MQIIQQIVLVCVFIFMQTAQSAVPEFRLDQDRVWLTAENEPLSQLLEHFAAAGIKVQSDPSAEKTVSGSWSDVDAETMLAEILSPYDYQIDWQRESGPLGEQTRLTGIRVFRKGFAEAMQPLRSRRRIEKSSDGRRFLGREVIVGFGPGSSSDNLHAFLVRTGGTIIDINKELGVYRILLPEGANILELVGQLGHDKSISLAEPNYVCDLPRLLPSDQKLSLPSGQWNAPSGDSPIAVAVLDSGLIPDDNLNRAVIGAFDATNPDSKLAADAVGHGTLMAQLAAGLLDPFNAPVGEGVSVVAVKAFADDGFADSFTLMNAMTYAVKNSTGPVSLSWGSETPSKFIESTVQYAMEKGRPVFAAVGNENTGKPMYPAAYAGVIGVAASSGGQMAEYSNRGDFVDLVAPGSAGGSQGTSVATAYVSHIAALYMQRHPGVTAAETVDALKKAAGPGGFLTEAVVKQLLAK
jgi:hypothetical protein